MARFGCADLNLNTSFRTSGKRQYVLSTISSALCLGGEYPVVSMASVRQPILHGVFGIEVCDRHKRRKACEMASTERLSPIAEVGSRARRDLAKAPC